MTQRNLGLSKAAVLAATLPVLLWAYEYGPDPGFAGVTGENGGATCAASGCHTGTVNSSAGSVTINLPNGLTYTPGVTQQLSVTIADPAATQRAWGFELTARVAGSTSTMAGSFASTDNKTQVLCSQSNLQRFQALAYSASGSQACNSTYPLAYIEHSLAGYSSSRGITGSYTFNFNWTPPSTNVGNITLFVAGNAANNNGSQSGDHIYSKSYTLAPASANTPAITGVVNGGSFQSGLSPNSWITLQGTNLSTSTDTWDNSIANGNLPTSLDGVQISVDGQAAYIAYVSPGQINAIAPNAGTGSVSVTVMNSNGTSAAATAVSQTVQPAFFQWGNYAVASRADYSLAVQNGTFANLTTAPAKPGDVLILWGTGFGPTTPAAPSGVEVPSTSTYYTASDVTVTIGGVPATVYGSALAPGYAGLYQIAIQVPPSLANGDYPVVATIAGAQSSQATMITVNQ